MRKRFTLIELLICCAIIGILVAMLLPALTGVKRKARRVVCMNNLKSIGTTHALYASEHRNYLILGAWYDLHQAGMYFSRPNGEHGIYEPLYNAGFMGDPQAWYCPGNTRSIFTFEGNVWPPRFGIDKTSIGYTSRVTFKTANGGDVTVRDWSNGWPTTSQYYASDPVKMSRIDPMQIIMADTVVHNAIIPNIHQGDGANGVRMDGSVKWTPLKEYVGWLSKITGPWARGYNDEQDRVFRELDE